ncbi:MAG: UTP--glucose-1-phosphate uridylyltransferase [Planctomycetota bacterium]|nr:UTP--glucose-1-phosphate uridylyltransferase [Planctomycetota bacterium]
MKSIPEAILNELTTYGQSHLLDFWDEITPAQQRDLVAEIAAIDWSIMGELISGKSSDTSHRVDVAAMQPPAAVRSDGEGVSWTVQDAIEAGEKALSAGEVAAVVVAGGQGTRLGFKHPKGMYPIGPISGRSLFQVFADRLRAINRRYEVEVPLYLMTSEATHAETLRYFSEHEYLGLSPSSVRIFKQGTMPAIDATTGRCLLSSKSSLALSPDGHGGTLAALENSGSLDDARQRGIKHLAYIQVDNPLAQLCDPALLGHHLLAKSEMTTQVVKKRYPLERVGNVVRVGDRVHIVEYSDLPESIAQQTGNDGELRFWAGNIAVHILDLHFLDRCLGQVSALPFHRALKAVEHLDAEGAQVKPDEPNALKFERFSFDLLPRAENALVVEAKPELAFAPVKNATGSEVDTPELAKQAICKLHRQWLRGAGVKVDETTKIEINPRFALDPSEVATRTHELMHIAEDRYFDCESPEKPSNLH